MEAKIIEQDGVNARLEVTVASDEVGKAYEAVVRAIAKEVRVDGFRPGKAPRRVIEAKVGKEAIDEEVRDALVERYTALAMHELKVRPVGVKVDATKPSEGEDYRFEVAVELYPQVELPDTSGIVIDTDIPQLRDEDYQEALEQLRREHATLVPVERPVERTDYLMVESLNSEAETTGNTMPLDLERMGDDFVERFFGKNIGDEVTLELTPPDHDHDHDGHDHHDHDDQVHEHENDDEDHDHRHEPVTLSVKITDIKAKEKPEADDEFAKTLGFDSWEEAESQIRKSLQRELDQRGFGEQLEEFTDKLTETSRVTVPPSLIERQKRHMIEQLEQDVSRRGSTSFDDFLASLGDDERQKIEREMNEGAEKRVRRELVLEKLLETRGSRVSDEEFALALELAARRRQQSVAMLRKDMGQEWLEDYRHILDRQKALRESLQEALGENMDEAEDEEAGADEAKNAEEGSGSNAG